MATEAKKFCVGLFVIGATVIAIFALVWLGATRFFEDSLRMVTYFSESVQGLEPGAAVKYRGVPAGRVEAIRIAPDGELIEVVVRIDPEVARSIKRDETLRAQLQLVGITGLRYVEIDRHQGAALDRSPQLSFEPPYPVIPSTPSQLEAIGDALEKAYRKVMELDLAGISQDTRKALQRMDQLLGNPALAATLENLQAVSARASVLVGRLEKATSGAELGPVVAELRRTLAEARALFHEYRSGPTGERVRAVLDDTRHVAGATEQLLESLSVTAERLDRAAANLQRLTEDLARQPSRLLFSAPPPETEIEMR